MTVRPTSAAPGEDLVKQELITRADLELAREQEATTGTPWYRQLIQKRKVSFDAIEDILRYEFHSKSVRTAQQSMGDTLVGMGVLSQAQLDEALQRQKRKGKLLGTILVEHGYASLEQIAHAFSRQHNLPYCSLERTPSERTALEAIPESIARKNEFIPVSVQGDRLDVLIATPHALDRLESAGVILGKRIHASITACADLKAELATRYDLLEGRAPSDHAARAPRQTVKQLDSEVPVESISSLKHTAPMENETVSAQEEYQVEGERESARFEAIARAASGSSVIQMVTTIIEGAVNSGATDIHLDPQEPEMRVRYRIDGVLHDIMSIPEALENAVISRIKIIAELDITDTRHPQDGHISLEVSEREFDVRVATLPTFLGERVVLRLLDQSSVLSGIRDLGLEPEDEETMTRVIEQPYGMILVTGPTGSGKTTTLYAALNQKNVMTDSIVTIEDPVEYQLSGINQVQIDTDIDVTFASTLRAALRQDIDVLLVGEIRDAETARIAIRAAMTGHLVFSTLHTNDAPSAVTRLRDMGIPTFLITATLEAILAQRLVRKICVECRTEFEPSDELLMELALPIEQARRYKFYYGRGCARCNNTGYKGRCGIYELLEVTDDIRDMIVGDASVDDIRTMARSQGMTTLRESGLKQIFDGVTTIDEVVRETVMEDMET